MAKIQRSTRPLWVSVAEAGRLLNRDRATVLKLVKEGKLRSRDDLGAPMVRYDDLDQPREDGLNHESWCSSDSRDDDDQVESDSRDDDDQVESEVGV
jgi:hypothetical protein